MIGYILRGDIEQSRHGGLREPQGFVLDERGDADGAVLGPVEGARRFGRTGIVFFHGDECGRKLRRACTKGLEGVGFRLLGVVGSDRALDFFVRHQTLDVLPGEFHEKRRYRKTVDALNTNREAPVLGSLPFVGIGRGQVFGERQRRYRGRRGRARGGRTMEGGAGGHGEKRVRAAASPRPRGGECGLEVEH